MSDSVPPQRQQPTRLPRPWDSPGKNTGVGCRFLLQCRKVKSESEVAQSCLTLSNPTDCHLPGSSAHGIFQARVLEWSAIAFSVSAFLLLTNCLHERGLLFIETDNLIFGKDIPALTLSSQTNSFVIWPQRLSCLISSCVPFCSPRLTSTLLARQG